MRAERNTASEEIGRLRRGRRTRRSSWRRMKALSTRLKEAEAELPRSSGRWRSFSSRSPNVRTSVPDGAGRKGTDPSCGRGGTPRAFTFPVRTTSTSARRWTSSIRPRGEDRRAAVLPVEGGGTADGAALINFWLDVHTREQGYLRGAPPSHPANSGVFFGTGQLPSSRRISSASRGPTTSSSPPRMVPVTNIVRDEILDAGTLP